MLKENERKEEGGRFLARLPTNVSCVQNEIANNKFRFIVGGKEEKREAM